MTVRAASVFNAAGQMDQTEEELQQINTWFLEQGLSPGASTQTQLCFLWRMLQLNKNNLNTLTKTLDVQRSQYATEILEVRKSLEQIRMFTGHKDVLAQEIQDENDQLRDQLRRLLSLQNVQMSEVAMMLYNQGLTELIHSSPSEQVAYLLVERSSLLETSSLNTASPNSDSPGTEVQPYIGSAGQTPQKRALRHNQSPWKRLFGLHKTQSKYQFIPAEHLGDQACSVQRECFWLEHDLEEGSRRLAMAHNEIRRLTDELESSHLIQRAYEPELEAAKQEVEHLRQEVEQLKKYEMMGLRKAKEMNDHLDLEIHSLRSKLRSLDAEKTTQEKGPTAAHTIKQLQTALVQTDTTSEFNEVTILQKEVEKLQFALKDQQTRAEAARELNEHLEAEVIQTNDVCRKLRNKLSIHMKGLLEKELEIEALKLELENCHNQNKSQDQVLLENSVVDCQQLERADCLSDNKDDFESLNKEICDVLKCLNQEQWKYQEMKEKLQTKLCRAKQRLKEETKWRDEKIEDLERELSLCSHSLTKEKELIIYITMENDKLLIEKRRLLQQLTNEVYNRKVDSSSVYKFRVDFLEKENKNLHNKMLDLSNQLLSLEQFAEELRNTCDLRKMNLLLTDLVSSSQCSSLARSAEIGYLNLNSHPLPLPNTTDP